MRDRVYVFENQLHCDITFTFQNKNVRNTFIEMETVGTLRPNFVSAHKYVLMSRSPAFYAKFTGANKSATCAVNVEDVEKVVFVKMLR